MSASKRPPRKPPSPAGEAAQRRRTSSSADPVTAYALAVGAGRIIAGPLVRAACRRHLDDLEHGAARGLFFSRPHAEKAIRFFEKVLHLNGGEFEGLPFILGAWQRFIVGSIFGWLRDPDGEIARAQAEATTPARRRDFAAWLIDGAPRVRRFRVGYMEIGKGNGKSPLAAGIGHYCLIPDREPRAEVYAAATKKDQAMVLFRDAVSMADLSPQLGSRLVRSGGKLHCWNLAHIPSGSFFRAIASDDGQSGPRPHCSLIDEVHEHNDATVINMLQAGQKGRRQPLTIEITNSGFDRTTICYQHHEYSERILRPFMGDGEATQDEGSEVDDSWFAYVCALDDGDDPLDEETGPACWIKANPNLGVSIRDDYLEEQVRKARGMPANASTCRRLNFCQWVDAANPWISGPLWMACERHEFDALQELARCEEPVGALDLSGTTDLTALALAGRIDGRVVARVEFWTPGETMVERARRDKVAYPAWVAQGFAVATPGRAVDYRWVASRLGQVQQALPLFRRAAYDPYRIAYLERDLDEENVELALIGHPQGYYKAAAKKDDDGEEIPGLWMPRSIELLEKLILDGLIDIEYSPILRWNSASAVVEKDAKGNALFSKRKSRGRIDGLQALAMAVGLLLEGVELGEDDDVQCFFV